MDYTNPFSAYNTNYGGAGQQGFVNQSETMETSQKNEMARPFIDMARKGQELDLQKKQTETNEFNSQEQKVMRAKQIMQKSQQADADIARINPQLALDLKKIDNELELSPFELAAKKAQAMEIARNIKGKPIQEFMNAAADFGNAMTKSKADSLTQASSYKDFVDSFKKQHPDTEIPPNMTTWSENLNKYLGLARMSSIYTSAFEQKDIEEKQKLASEEKRTGMTAGATVQAAKITSEGATERAELGQPTKDQANAVRMQDVLRKEIDSDPVMKGLLIRAYNPEMSETEHKELSERIANRKREITSEFQSRMGGDTTPSSEPPKPIGWSDDKEKRLQELRKKLGK